jgi:hypothetical protein
VHAGRQRDTGAKSAEGLRHGRTSIEVTNWEGCSSCDSFLGADRNASRCRYTTAGLSSWMQGKQPTVYSLMQAAGCKLSVSVEDKDKERTRTRQRQKPRTKKAINTQRQPAPCTKFHSSDGIPTRYHMTGRTRVWACTRLGLPNQLRAPRQRARTPIGQRTSRARTLEITAAG